MNASTPPALPPRKTLASIAKWSLRLMVAAWLLLALAWGALHVWIVPRIGELRPALEARARQALGVPVRIASVTAQRDGLIPSFELSDVVLLDPQGREALRLPRVTAAVTPRSLWNLGFEQLFIDRPQLDIRRTADGKILVAGLDFSKGEQGGGEGADWVFSQTELVIRGGSVHWRDELRGAPPLALSNVDFVMRNGARRHALRLDGTPPPEWGDRFSLRGVFQQPLLSNRAGDWQQWSGELYADFPRVDVSRLRQHARLGAEISRGHGTVRAWVDVARGQVGGATADLALSDVSTRLAADRAPLELASLSGRLSGKRLEDGFEFQTQGLQFQAREGPRWPGGNVYVQWTGASGRQPARGELRADQLDLGVLGQIAERLPLGAATHQALLTYAPRGLVETVQARWQGPLDALQRYEARGRAARLEVAGRPAAAARTAASGARAPAGSPGLRGLWIDFDLSQAGGRGQVRMQKGALELPGVFEDPIIPVDELTADVQWQINGEDISAAVNNLRFANADAQGQAQVSWRTGDPARSGSRSRLPGVLDLQGTLSRADGTRVWRYLPLAVPKDARDYVRDAVQQGQASGAKFRVRGDLWDFPFGDPKQGEFRISADVRNATYAYVPPRLTRNGPPWPALTQLSGELVFEGNGMRVRGASGRFAGAGALQVKADAQIADLRATTVQVNAGVRGPLAEALEVVNHSPVTGLLNQALARASASGNTEVRLQLGLPIARIDQSTVQGSVTLAGNDVQITPDSPVLTRARGVVAFSERGFTLGGAQARALGGEVRLEGGSRSAAPGEPSVQLRAQGTATAEGLRQARELGFVSRLARDASGSAAYMVNLAFRRGQPELTVTSSLQGLALNLPAPLAKGAEAALPLRYETALTREAQAGGRLQDQLKVELGRVAQAAYVRDVSGEQPQVLRGSVAVGLGAGETVALPEQGVAANISLDGVNVDAWEAALANATGADAAATPAVSPYLPTVLAVRAREITAAGRKLHNLVVGGSREGPVWRTNVVASELDGYVEYRQPTGAGAGRVHARLARLAIAAAEARQVETLLDESTSNLPALDVVVDDFELRGKKLGRLEIDALNRGAGAATREGGAREWRLAKLNLISPEATLSANGNWVAVSAQGPVAGARPAAGERRRTVMNFRLDLADAGQLLNRLGMPDVIRAGRGRMEGQLAWLGSPLTLDYASMTGVVSVNVENGQFLKADPGLAKLLGVLSLQSLPRRLTLDFRDVFSQGFAFDFVRGDVTVQQGMAATNNLQMKGVNAAVLMEGKADIARETQDLKVVVVPEINAGTASLVATAINPAIGLGSFLAQLFLREPLIRANTQEFRIDGTWADPRVTKVERQLSGAARVESAQRAGGGVN